MPTNDPERVHTSQLSRRTVAITGSALVIGDSNPNVISESVCMALLSGIHVSKLSSLKPPPGHWPIEPRAPVIQVGNIQVGNTVAHHRSGARTTGRALIGSTGPASDDETGRYTRKHDTY